MSKDLVLREMWSRHRKARYYNVPSEIADAYIPPEWDIYYHKYGSRHPGEVAFYREFYERRQRR